MKFAFAAMTLAVVGMMGVVHAEPATGNDESVFTLDLEKVAGTSFHILCKSGNSLLNCKQPSLWQNTNTYPGLQTGVLKVGSTRYDPDEMLLG